MAEFFIWILKFLSQMRGAGVGLLFLTCCIFLGTVWVFKKITSAGNHEDHSKRAGDPGSSSSFQNHLFFSHVSMLKASTIHSLPIADPARRELFKDLLILKIDSLHDSILAFIKEHEADLNELEEADFSSKLLTLFSNSLTLFEYTALNKKDPIPVEVINVFNKWHQPTLKFTHDFIAHTVMNPFWTSNADKLNSVLEMYCILCKRIVDEGYLSFNDLNGELDNLVYKGLRIATKDVSYKAVTSAFDIKPHKKQGTKE